MLSDRSGYTMVDFSDYKTSLRGLGISLFFMVLLSATMLEIYLLVFPVRNLHPLPQIKHISTDSFSKVLRWLYQSVSRSWIKGPVQRARLLESAVRKVVQDFVRQP